MLSEAKFNRFSIALKDLEKAHEFLEEARKHQYGSLIHEALVFSAIVCFFRPFTDNEKDPNSKAAKRLEKSDFEPPSNSEIQIYETCKELRNKALAHAEFKYHPTKLERETGIISSAIFSLVGKAADLKALQGLIDKFIERCRNRQADYIHNVRAH
jgi:hypothetical protein